jgi:hypothetical protein
MKQIAQEAYGSEDFWGRVYDLNPKQRADEPLPAGTKVVLTSDAKIGE